MVIAGADELGAVLRRARLDKGWSQQRLAAMVGVSRQWIASVEAGAPNARLGLVIDALRCVDLLLETHPDDSQAILDAIPGFRP